MKTREQKIELLTFSIVNTYMRLYYLKRFTNKFVFEAVCVCALVDTKEYLEKHLK